MTLRFTLQQGESIRWIYWIFVFCEVFFSLFLFRPCRVTWSVAERLGPIAVKTLDDSYSPMTRESNWGILCDPFRDLIVEQSKDKPTREFLYFSFILFSIWSQLKGFRSISSSCDLRLSTFCLPCCILLLLGLAGSLWFFPTTFLSGTSYSFVLLNLVALLLLAEDARLKPGTREGIACHREWIVSFSWPILTIFLENESCSTTFSNE